MPGYTVSCNIVKMLKYVCLFFLKQIARKKILHDIWYLFKAQETCVMYTPYF